MKKKLSKALQAAIKRYLDNRDNRDSQSATFVWDKPADQKAISEIAFTEKSMVRVEQSSGRWWFTVKRGAQRWTFYAHEDNYTQTLTGTQATSCSPLTTLFGRA